MKALPFFIAVLFHGQTMFAQSSNSAQENGLNNFFLANLKNGQVADAFNYDIYAGVEGSPYFWNDWAYARITLDDNRKFDSVLIKLNLYENKIIFKDNDGRERMVAIPVKEKRWPFSKR